MKKKNMKLYVSLMLLSLSMSWGCMHIQKQEIDVDAELDYCVSQASKTLNLMPKEGDVLPRSIPTDQSDWRYVEYEDWTSGFWPGVLWYLYEHTNEEKWLKEADKFTQYLEPLSVRPASDHDLGFQVFNSAGNGYRLTNNELYKSMVLKSADTLATLFNPTVGTILSWPVKVEELSHNTIVDNLINLELLFWAAKNGENTALYDLAVRHAEKTMANHFREDYSAYHVVVYDTLTGEKVKGVTHQGYADETMWARGQSWAIYGYTMIYRETRDAKFLDFAHKVAGVYLDRLPDDLIPFWDFDAPKVPNEPKDASAAAVVASSLFELAGYTDDKKLAKKYIQQAKGMLKELSDKYKSEDQNTAFLLHSTGHHPNGSEIDVSIIYADYYYVEALLRLKRYENGLPIIGSALALSNQ